MDETSIRFKRMEVWSKVQPDSAEHLICETVDPIPLVRDQLSAADEASSCRLDEISACLFLMRELSCDWVVRTSGDLPMYWISRFSAAVKANQAGG